MDLAVPLSRSQVIAANRLHASLKRWRRGERALESLKERFPGFGQEATLLKAVAINSLYGTNVFAIARLAERVSRVLVRTKIGRAGPDLVESIAILPSEDADQEERRFISFASKFAHFFIDSDRFPICDSYAAAMLKFHLKGTTSTQVNTPSYSQFVVDFFALKESVRLSCSTRQLDHYLWLAGLYRHYRKGKKKINVEARTLFETASAQIRAHLDRLLPSRSGESPNGGL